MAEPERRRRRPAVSCTLCRKRKIRCNKELPCNNCLRSKTGTCVYDNPPPRPPQKQQHQTHLHEQPAELRDLREAVEPHYATPQDTGTTLSTASGPASRQPTSLAASSSATTLVGRPADREIDVLRSRVRELEAKLSQTNPSVSSAPTSQPHIESLSTGLSGAFHVQHHSNLFGETDASSRSVIHKKRLFGQSHWINGGLLMFKDLVPAIEPYVRDESSKAVCTIGKCKALARHIKSRRAPEWPTAPTPELPPKEVADELVDCYLRTVETAYRILHVPTFKRDYEALWVSDSTPDAEFLVKLKLVLALGSLTYDERCSMRTAATRWVYEAQTWVSDLRFKARLGIDFLQTHLLLLLSRELVLNNVEAIWIAAGSLIRMAMYIGLHRDPARFPRQTTHSAEMRRRLWNTILEVCLQSTISSGGPPLISLQDFDTEPPGNFDDDQLATEDPVPKPEHEFTQVTVARALRRTFPLRLSVTKYLNDMNSRTAYEDALHLDKELRASHRDLCKTLQSCSSPSSNNNPFAFRFAEFIMHRYISSIHAPFFDRSLRDSSCAYSRKAVVDTSLKIWCAVDPSSSVLTSQPPTNGDDALLARFIKCSSGFFRTVSMQAIINIAVELRAQLQENDGLGPSPLRRDLLAVLEDSKTWMVQCIQAGETNPKGYLFHSMMIAQVSAIMQSATKDEISAHLVKAAEEAGDNCLRLLENLAAEGQSEGVSGELDQIPWSMPTGLISEMEFMISDPMFDGTTNEQMNWMFTDDTPTLWA